MTTPLRMLLGRGVSTYDSSYSGVLTAGTVSTITDDSKYNAWPSVCRLANGWLFLTYVKSNGHNIDNSGVIVARISSDDGATWSPEVTIASDASKGCINPGVASLASGRVILMYNLFDHAASPRTPTDAVRVIYSDDHGVTWSSPYTVDSTFTLSCASGTSRPIQLPDGTVMLAVYGQNTGNTFWTSRIFTSSDDGETFGGETTIANGQSDGRDYNEPSLCILDDGVTILGHYRTADVSNMYQNKSTDGGSTWSAPASKYGGYSPANLYQRRFGHTIISTVRGNAAAKLEAFTCTDRAGTTWTSQGILDATTYTELEYACAVDKLDGSLLVLYSVQPTASTSNADIKQVVVSEAA